MQEPGTPFTRGRSLRTAATIIAVCLAVPCLASLVLGALGRATKKAEPSRLKADAETLFKDCTTASVAKAERHWGCANLEAMMMRTPESSLSDARMLEAFSQGLLQEFFEGGKVATETTELTVGQRTFPALRLTARALDAKIATGQLALTHLPNGEVELFGCLVKTAASGGPERCRQVLEYFATNGSPDVEAITARPAEVAPAVLGTKLRIPTGCSVAELNADSTRGEVRCDGAFLKWSEERMSEADWVNVWETMKKVPELAGASERRLSCEVAGLAGDCFELSTPSPRTFVLINARATGMRPLALTCGFAGETDGGVAEICNGLLTGDFQ